MENASLQPRPEPYRKCLGDNEELSPVHCEAEENSPAAYGQQGILEDLDSRSMQAVCDTLSEGYLQSHRKLKMLLVDIDILRVPLYFCTYMYIHAFHSLFKPVSINKI